MRIKVSNAKKLSGIIFLFASVGLVAMAPSVYAMQTPDFDTDPLFPVAGGSVELTWTGDGDAPHDVRNIEVTPPSGLDVTNTGPAAIGATVGDCDAAFQIVKPENGDDGHVFELQETGSQKAVSFLIANSGDTIMVPFPNGPGNTPVTIVAVGAGTSASVGTAIWRDITFGLGDIDPSLNELGQYKVPFCGIDTPGNFQLAEGFTVKPPVGGALLSIDTTSLIIAGATANALWILPVLGLAAIGSIALLKFQVARRA